MVKEAATEASIRTLEKLAEELGVTLSLPESFTKEAVDIAFTNLRAVRIAREAARVGTVSCIALGFFEGVRVRYRETGEEGVVQRKSSAPGRVRVLFDGRENLSNISCRKLEHI